MWTCGKGVYAEPVAEHALTLLLAGLRGLVHYARADGVERASGAATSSAARVTIVGGGGIAESLLRLLGPFGADVTVVRRQAADAAWSGRRPTVVRRRRPRRRAAPGPTAWCSRSPLLPDTGGSSAGAELEAMEPHAWLVNVARGGHVVTDDLVEALRDGVDRRGGPRRDRSGAAARGPPALDAAELSSSHRTSATPRRWPSRCSPAADHRERPPLRPPASR